LAGSENPKKKLRFLLADAENWRDLKTKKKIKILFEGASWLKGAELADAENWRDLKTPQKN
jgi:hypothetical protein